MANVSQIEQCLKLVLEARASTLARETGFIKRQRKWSRADLIRPRLSDRKAFEAIVYVLRTGIQWNALPRELGASSTIPDRFQHWEQAGLFYDSTPVYGELLAHHYQPHVRSSGEEWMENEIIPGHRARRSRGGAHPFLAQSFPSDLGPVGEI